METIWVVILGFVCGFAGWNGYLNWRLRRAVLQAERLLREQELERLRIVAGTIAGELDRINARRINARPGAKRSVRTP